MSHTRTKYGFAPVLVLVLVLVLVPVLVPVLVLLLVLGSSNTAKGSSETNGPRPSAKLGRIYCPPSGA
jgi:hypothetical protein